MMKILVLNPHFHESTLISRLQKQGVGVLVCDQLGEADLVLKLHGRSISLVVAHGEPGVQLNESLKKSEATARLPVILTLPDWTPKQCAAHQSSTSGANAYVKWPVVDGDLLGIIDQVMATQIAQGQSFSAGASASAPVSPVLPITESAPSVTEELSKPISLELGFADPIASPVAVASPLEAEAPPTEAVHTIDFGSSQPATELPSGDDASGISIASISIEDPTSLFAGGVEPAADSGLSIDIPLSLDLDLGEPPVIESSGSAPEFSAPESASVAPTEELSLASAALGTAEPLLSEPASLEPAIDSGGLSFDAPSFDSAPAESVAAEASPSIDGPLADFSLSPSSPSIEAPTASAPVSEENTNDDIDPRTMEDMPYLSKRGLSPLAHRHPVDDAVVPGGAAQSPDEDTLKRYLQLREQDVAALSSQFRQAKEQVSRMEQELRHERAINSEFAHLVQEQDRRIQDFEREKTLAVESVQKETEDLRFEMKRKVDKMKLLELQVRDASGETEKLKERVRADIRKIRLREKELENRLEIMKKDSEALLGARENKIIELKRKLDLLEFNLDLLQDQYDKEKSTSAQLREKLLKAAQVVRVAGGLLHNETGAPEEPTFPASGRPRDGDKTSAA